MSNNRLKLKNGQEGYSDNCEVNNKDSLLYKDSMPKKSILDIIRNYKGMVFAVILALASASGGCRGCGACSDGGDGEEYYAGCDPENNRVVCGSKTINPDNTNKRN